MKKLHVTRALMVSAILLIALFEAYWLVKLYKDEYNNLKKEADVTFRETVFNLQRQRFEKDTLLVPKTVDSVTINPATAGKPQYRFTKTFSTSFSSDTLKSVTVNGYGKKKETAFKFREGMPILPSELLQVLVKSRMRNGDSNRIFIKIDTSFGGKHFFGDSATVSNIFLKKKVLDSTMLTNLPTEAIREISVVSGKSFYRNPVALNEKKATKKNNAPGADVPKPTSAIIRLFSSNKTLNDSIPVRTVDSAYKAELVKLKRNLKYQLLFKVCDSTKPFETTEARDTGRNFVTSTLLLGFNTPFAYSAVFSNVPVHLLQKMQPQIIGSALLLFIVLFAFIALYNNLVEQRKLAIIKNEFISNITHELKTPIATVTVAIEALQRFNAIDDPARTKEYLNISSAELQRLSLLVDKVLKLSMFENKAIELNKEWIDVEQLVKDVISSMKLLFEKQKAHIVLQTDGNSFIINADKLHITSVIYNLLDNALKYSTNNPEITVVIQHHKEYIDLIVSDKGIGISNAYKEKIFEKFFRVPTGDKHNIKGYGLGLSYVSHIAKTHHGLIEVETALGKGSTFTVKLPVKDAAIIDYGNGKKVVRKDFKL